MASILSEVEKGALEAIITVIQGNPGLVSGYLASGEAAVSAGLANLIKNIPSVKGALGLVVNPLEGAVEAGLEAYVASLLVKYNPAELETLLVQFLQNLAAKL